MATNGSATNGSATKKVAFITGAGKPTLVAKYLRVLTGSASGMGQAVARDLVKKGWTIAVIDLDRTTGKAAAKEFGGIFVATNVFVYESIANAFERVWEEYGRIDFGMTCASTMSSLAALTMRRIVFANAGLVGLEPFYKIQSNLPPKKPQMIDNEVNTVGVYYTCYLAMHYMRQNPEKSGGQIIITSSGKCDCKGYRRCYHLT